MRTCGRPVSQASKIQRGWEDLQLSLVRWPVRKISYWEPIIACTQLQPSGGSSEHQLLGQFEINLALDTSVPDVCVGHWRQVQDWFRADPTNWYFLEPNFGCSRVTTINWFSVWISFLTVFGRGIALTAPLGSNYRIIRSGYGNVEKGRSNHRLKEFGPQGTNDTRMSPLAPKGDLDPSRKCKSGPSYR